MSYYYIRMSIFSRNTYHYLYFMCIIKLSYGCFYEKNNLNKNDYYFKIAFEFLITKNYTTLVTLKMYL